MHGNGNVDPRPLGCCAFAREAQTFTTYVHGRRLRSCVHPWNPLFGVRDITVWTVTGKRGAEAGEACSRQADCVSCSIVSAQRLGTRHPGLGVDDRADIIPVASRKADSADHALRAARYFDVLERPGWLGVRAL